MAFTRLTTKPDADGSATTIYFRGDVRYSLNWDLVESEALARPRGGDIAYKTAGQSITSIDVTGILLNAVSGDVSPDQFPRSAERQLWDDLYAKLRDSMGSKTGGVLIKATLVLEVGNGTITATGWARNFIGDRDAPEGLESIPVTFNFMLDTAPTTSLV